ncbi:MAG: hypothetical protein M1827_001847 [Pycnora praestabilis]|nr:MAG: hypothetical protein M1827_001847 [Pycnora praestabilis]
MQSNLATTYLLPAFLLNPILLLHTLNWTLSRALPSTTCINPTSIALPSPSTLPTWGPAGTLPHLDIHASDPLCWVYTAFIVGVQLFAFGRVSSEREGMRNRKAAKAERLSKWEERKSMGLDNANGHFNGHASGNGKANSNADRKTDEKFVNLEQWGKDEEWDETTTEEDEELVIL